MNKKLRDINIGVAVYLCSAAIVAKVLEKRAEKTTYTAEAIEPIETRKQGFYEKYIKRAADVVCASAAITVFAPLYAGVAFEPCAFHAGQTGHNRTGWERANL